MFQKLKSLVGFCDTQVWSHLQLPPALLKRRTTLRVSAQVVPSHDTKGHIAIGIFGICLDASLKPHPRGIHLTDALGDVAEDGQRFEVGVFTLYLRLEKLNGLFVATSINEGL